MSSSNWNKREYHNGGLGLEETYDQYIAGLPRVFGEVKGVLKPTGSLWLNIGDTYKELVGIPWRIALAMMDEQKWILRNDVVWNKIKGPDNANDKLRNIHEWEIIPEDTQSRDDHYAAYPEDLCRIPLAATCPPDGIALDPFCGTGTTNLVAMQLFRKSVGIDISQKYIDYATERCRRLLTDRTYVLA